MSNIAENRTWIMWVFAFFLSIFLLSITNANANKFTVVGYLEKATILPENLVVYAKMDTGSDSTSIHATDLKRYKRNGENWIRFTVDVDGRLTVFHRRIIRHIRIRRAETQDVRRPVVYLRICIAGRSVVAATNLSDRTGFYSQMLVGRPYMKSGKMLVDPASVHVGNPKCKILPDRD